MKASIKQHILLAVTLAASTASTMAQEFNSAYFTDDFKYRHTMNAAYGNDQGYAAIPILGNLNIRLQGSFGVGDVLFPNPYYGSPLHPNAKKTATFLHPAISADEGLSKLDKDRNTIMADIGLTIASVGFKAFGGYNTIELKENTRVGLSLPYEFFEFAKDLNNKDYDMSDLSFRAQSYVELAFGHSRKIMDDLRVGAKLKVLLGAARADFTMDHMHASLTGNKWILEGKARGELNLKGATFKTKPKEYKSKQETYPSIDDIDIDGAGLGGFGLGVDLGAIYDFKNIDVEWLKPLKVSMALNDLGFISWSNCRVVETHGEPFEFDGFQDITVKKNTGNSLSERSDQYADKLTDFVNLEDKGDEGGKTTMLATTLKLGAEYTLPMYDKVSFGLLGTHRFEGDYSWTEGRLSANYRPLSWLDGGVNVAVTSFCTTMGWVINFHPVGMNVFFGMDHMVGKTGASMVPLSSNLSFCMGFTAAWGGKKKNKKG